MRVRDLLTMSTGHHDEDIRDFPFASSDSLVKRFLSAAGVAQAGNVLRLQHAGELHAVGDRAEGHRADGARLSASRDSSNRSASSNPTWEASKQGVSLGGFGLSVRTEDIARFGQLYLQKGQWQGKQLVPAAWVDAATSRQMSNGSSPTSDWEQGYGYQFWRCRHGFYRGDGAHGQFCIVMPQYDTVVAITSGTRDMASVMNLVWDRLVPALEADGAARRHGVERQVDGEAGGSDAAS